jgi:hypothetical protein
MFRYKYAVIGAILAPSILRLNLQGTGFENDPKRFILPVLFGAVAGLLIGLMKDRWVRLNHNLEACVVERTKELQQALDEVNTLREIIPICSFCKHIRNDKGYYEQIELYFHNHSNVDFSHTICPDCMKEHYPEEYVLLQEEHGKGK